ncbi:MAG: thermosome subunit alpha [Candidatus Bathyarchaeia archaeon]
MSSRILSENRVPVIILKEGTQRTQGREAQINNLRVAKIIAETMKTSLGPKGMDKMLVDKLGNIIVTNDGATIMKLVNAKHPIAKIFVEIARSQDIEVGDGTTSVVVLAGELLAKAEELIRKGIHPVTIINGYKKALKKALEVIDKISVQLSLNDKELLKEVAKTAMAAKFVSHYADYLADIAVESVFMIAEKENESWKIDLDNIKIEKKVGGSINDSMIIKGIVLDKEAAHPDMPRRIRNARIALLDTSFEIKKAELNAKLYLENANQYRKFLEEKEEVIKEMVDRLADIGVNFLCCRMRIDEKAEFFMAKRGIMAIERVKRSDLEKISKATGARIAARPEEITEDDLGKAEYVEERKIGGENKLTVIEGCENPKAISILVRGATREIVDEAERSLIDALSAVRNIFVENKIIAGGGSSEIEIASVIRNYAETLFGKEQLAVEKFAEAIESLPAQLAESSGLDPIEAVTTLRAMHRNGKVWAGVDVLNGRLHDDMFSLRVFEPLIVKKQILKTAVEAALMILKIDDIIIASSVADRDEEEKVEEEA